MTRLLRWWRTRPWRGYRPDRIDRLDVERLVRETWADMVASPARVVGVVMLGVRADGSVQGAQFLIAQSIRDDVWRAAGLAALLQAQGGETDRDEPREVN